MESFDTTDIHGGLLSLFEISNAYRGSEKDPSVLEGYLRNVRHNLFFPDPYLWVNLYIYQIFKYLIHVSDIHLTTTRNDLVVAASCRVIANSITATEIGLGDGSSVMLWKKIVDVGLKHRSTSVQEAAADAMRMISDLTDSSADVSR